MKPITVSLLLSCTFGALISVSSHAQGLPKTGTIKIHTGWKIGSEVFEAPDNRSVGHGSVVGVNFNDAGSGPLHNGPAICVFTFLGAKDGSMNKGYCAFGDEDGDRIFTDWDGNATAGTNRIAGGTGKYQGITGSGPWKCAGTANANALRCTQQFDYKLP